MRKDFAIDLMRIMTSNVLDDYQKTRCIDDLMPNDVDPAFHDAAINVITTYLTRMQDEIEWIYHTYKGDKDA